MARRVVVFYVSGHGFGHASRSIEIINALIRRDPDIRIIIRSSIPRWLVERTASPGVELSPRDVDTGVVQLGSLHLDAPASIERATAFMSTFVERVRTEVEFLRAQAATLAISDVPPLGIAAGRAAGIAAIATGNFTWDWIYEYYAGGEELARHVGEVYRATTLALRMPMWGGFETMPNVQDLSFVARRSQRAPAEVRAALGIPLERLVVLPSFGGYGLEGFDLAALSAMSDYHVLLPGMLDEQSMYDSGFRYEDLVGAVDVVVTKPGYGIISECLANDTALLYTSRGVFREYQLLVDAMPAFLRCEFIDHSDLFAGQWAPYLDAVLAQPPPPSQPATNGADTAADILMDLLE